jgi:hypothetical protein
VFIVVYFVIDSVRKLLDTPSYIKITADLNAVIRAINRDKVGGDKENTSKHFGHYFHANINLEMFDFVKYENEECWRQKLTDG